MSTAAPRRHRVLRRLARAAVAVTIGLVTLAAVLIAGVTATPSAAPVPSAVGASPATASHDEGRLVVAVVLGTTGTDPGDAFGPYEVFARSSRFEVYTVAADRSPAQLDGGLAVQPAFTFADIDRGAGPSPDVVVVPALNDPAGDAEAQLREWIVQQEESGAHILGVCAGARVLAAAGVLDGHRATSHWSWIGPLEESSPAVEWVRGQRYVQDGPITTTAGVSSGIPGALKVLQDLAGDAEAEVVGREMDYPSWSLGGPIDIPVRNFALADAPLGLNVVLPWFRPTVGVLLSDSVGELDAVAPFEVNSYSSAATLLPIAEGGTVTTEHGLVLYTTPTSQVGGVDRLVAAGAGSADDLPADTAEWATSRGLTVSPLRSAAGRGGFDAALEDLAVHADAATARATAKMIDYPVGRLSLAGGFDGRAPLLLAVALVLATGAGFIPSAIRALRRHRSRQEFRAVA
jgi:putative intracellular protease/amidase